jgi:hypothetical protein
MTTKKKTKPDKELLTKARQVLEFAEVKARQAADWIELHNAIFSAEGRATKSFPTEAERTAFTKTAEYRRILALLNTLPYPPAKKLDEGQTTINGAISVRLPYSVQAALLAEARAEGVSLNELCAAKLVAQLRTVIDPAKERAG